MQLRERLQRVGGVAVYESWNRNRECAVMKNSYYFNIWLLSGEKNDCEETLKCINHKMLKILETALISYGKKYDWG